MKSTFVFDGSIYVLDIVLFKKKKKKVYLSLPPFFLRWRIVPSCGCSAREFCRRAGGLPGDISSPIDSLQLRVRDCQSLWSSRATFFSLFSLCLKFQKFSLFRNYYWLAKFIDVFFIILTRKSLQPVYSTCVSFDHVVSLTPFFFPFSECLPVIQQRCWNRPSGSFPSSF